MVALLVVGNRLSGGADLAKPYWHRPAGMKFLGVADGRIGVALHRSALISPVRD